MTPSNERTTQVAEWKRLTEQVLPALAKQHGWPLRLDHCFNASAWTLPMTTFGTNTCRNLPSGT